MNVLEPVTLAVPENLEAMRRRIRSRYPILRDGIMTGGGARKDGATASGMLGQALKAIREESGDGGVIRTYSAECLRRIVAATDTAKIYPRDSRAQIVLLEVGPSKVHAYWHVPDEVMGNFRTRLGEEGRDAQLALRFYDITDSLADKEAKVHSFDIEVLPDEEHRYIEMWSSDRIYSVELGLRAGEKFLPIARSNSVHIPRGAEGDEAFVSRDIAENRTPRALLSMPDIFRVAARPVIVCPGDADWPLRDLEAERQVRAAYGQFLLDGAKALRNCAPVVRRGEEALRHEYDLRQKRLQSQAVSTGDLLAPAMPQRRKPAVFIERLDAEAKVPAFETGAESREKNKREFPLAMRGRRLLDSIRNESVAPVDLAIKQSRGPVLNAERISGGGKSSPRVRELNLKKSDRLLKTLSEAGVELEAELVLRGRVKPGKKVRIGGRIIETAPDGSFCVSCMIKDGKLVVPVEVVEAKMVIARQDISVDAAAAISATI